MANIDNTMKGVVLMVIAMMLLPGLDAIAKSVGERLPVGQIVWSRFFFQSIYMGIAAATLLKPEQRRLSQTRQHIFRACMITLATLLFFSALQVMPLAESISIFFVEPLILTLLAALFLGEQIGWRRMLAVALGFVGAMLIVRPEFAKAGWAALLPLGAASAFAVYLLLTKRLTGHTHPIAIQLFTGVAALAVVSIILAAGSAADIKWLSPVAPSWQDAALLALLGLIASGGHLLMVMAFVHAPASTLAPLQYLEIVSATVLGFYIFGDFPDLTAWCGVAIIVGSGLFVAWRERQANEQPKQEV